MKEDTRLNRQKLEEEIWKRGEEEDEMGCPDVFFGVNADI